MTNSHSWPKEEGTQGLMLILCCCLACCKPKSLTRKVFALPVVKSRVRKAVPERALV